MRCKNLPIRTKLIIKTNSLMSCIRLAAKSLQVISMVTMLLVLGNMVQAQTPTNMTFPAGSFIINMGVSPQTINNGLRPYGLVYQLLALNCPVHWVINQTKDKDGIDFSHNGVDYKGGTFIVEAKYRTSSVNAIIATWTNPSGTHKVVGANTVSPVTVPVYLTFNNVPSWTLDKKNGSIAVTFFNNAGIPSTAYGGTSSTLWKDPAELDCCDDIFVMPHADPIWSTHGHLWGWVQATPSGPNTGCKGGVWLGCHAGSALENMVNPIDRQQQTNFLTVKDPAWTGTTGSYTLSNSLILWGSHADGTPPYSYRLHTDPVAQFLGTIDAATQNGSEQIYMPRQGIVATPSIYSSSAVARWRPETKVIVYDPTQVNVTNPDLVNFSNVAAVLAYGPAFGIEGNGDIMLEASHSIAKLGNHPASVAAQRAFFNYSFMVAWDKAVLPEISPLPGVVYSGQEYPLSFTTVANVPPAPVQTYSLVWSASCGGTFLDPDTRLPDNTHPNPIYIPPTAPTPLMCNISLTITDDCGRTTFDSEAVLVECNLSVSTTITNLCPGSTYGGAIQMVFTNGTGPFTFSWTKTGGIAPFTGAGTLSSAPYIISNLSTGTYTVTATANNGAGCPVTFTVVLSQSPEIILSAIPVQVSCNGGSNGAINVTVSGGTPGYTYSWSDGPVTQNRSGLSAGTYTLTVTDVRNCIKSTSVTVTQPSPMVITPTITPVSCFGQNSGQISLSVTGGTGSYIYSWSDGNSNQNRSGLAPGIYSVTVTDANNCTQTLGGIEVTQPAAGLNLSTTQVNVLCFGGNNGSINLTVSGGTPFAAPAAPYTYSWTKTGSSFTASTEDIGSLTEGTYNVTVTDSKGCTATLSVTITQPAALSLSVAKTDATCPPDAQNPGVGSDGVINLTVSGGATPYASFVWSGYSKWFHQTTQNLTGLIAGTYTVLVTDANGCTATTSVTLVYLNPNPEPPSSIIH
jgi:hypothetical protein